MRGITPANQGSSFVDGQNMPGSSHGATPLAGQLRCASGSECRFDATSVENGSDRAPAQEAIHRACHLAHTNLLDVVQDCQNERENGPGEVAASLNLIDNAESQALEAVFQHASDPDAADEVYANGHYAARVGVADIAVLLSVLRQREGNPDTCDKFEKKLCELMLTDGLKKNSGFSSWRPGNRYDAVDKLIKEVNTELRNLPDQSDIFESTMQNLVMPQIRSFLESRYGHLSYATWQKIDAARGLISRAAEQAANRMTDSLRVREESNSRSALHAEINRWRVAHYWADLMRGDQSAPTQSQERPQGNETQAPASTIHDRSHHRPQLRSPVAESATSGTSNDVAPHGVSQTANPVIYINFDDKKRCDIADVLKWRTQGPNTTQLLEEMKSSRPDQKNRLGAEVSDEDDSAFSETSDTESLLSPVSSNTFSYFLDAKEVSRRLLNSNRKSSADGAQSQTSSGVALDQPFSLSQSKSLLQSKNGQPDIQQQQFSNVRRTPQEEGETQLVIPPSLTPLTRMKIHSPQTSQPSEEALSFHPDKQIRFLVTDGVVDKGHVKKMVRRIEARRDLVRTLHDRVESRDNVSSRVSSRNSDSNISDFGYPAYSRDLGSRGDDGLSIETLPAAGETKRSQSFTTQVSGSSDSDSSLSTASRPALRGPFSNQGPKNGSNL